jgi:hypothetical protein
MRSLAQIELALYVLNDPDLDSVADRIADKTKYPISINALADARRVLCAAIVEIDERRSERKPKIRRRK